MRIPDFFLAGAPKSGTTSLYASLAAHPGIYMPTIKEPHFFADDLQGWRAVKTRSDYLRLYADAPPAALLGDASVFYLFSKTAIPNILALNQAAKFIVILRNPIDAAYALHANLYRDLHEDVKDFRRAWNLQSERARGNHVPEFCRDANLLQYKEIFSFGSQILRFTDIIPSPQRLVLLFDDFVSDQSPVREAISRFLNVANSTEHHSFAHLNPNRALRSRQLAEWIRAHLDPNAPTYRITKRALNQLKLHPVRWIERANLRSARRPQIDPSFRRQLAGEFAADIAILESALGRSLAPRWLPDAPPYGDTDSFLEPER